MESLRIDSPAGRMIIAGLGTHNFTLLDVGCSGGLHPAWRQFGGCLTAFGFDPSLHAIESLSFQETNKKVTYTAGFIGLPDGHPAKGADPDFWRVDPWSRLAAHHSQNLQQKIVPNEKSREDNGEDPSPCPNNSGVEEHLMARNLWLNASLAAPQPIVLSEFLTARNISDVDFVKIDVDGTDFEILQSLGPIMSDLGVLGVILEVNFHGSSEPQANTFHNMDRYMREQGFDLFDLTVRKYSNAKLPFPYLYPHPFAAQGLGGRPFQGDALYLRDLGYPHGGLNSEDWTDQKLLKLAALYALFGLYDHAAELLQLNRPRLADYLDLEATLDALAAELQQSFPDIRDENAPILSYADYMALYESDDHALYGAEARIAAARSLPRIERDEARLFLSNAQRALADSCQRLAETELRLEERDREITLLKTSTFWRATGPLRALVDRLKPRRRTAFSEE